MTRREFLRIARNAAVGSALAGGLTTAGYATLFEPNRLKISRTRVQMKRLPMRLDGLRIVLMADFHLFPFTSAELVQKAVYEASALKPDLPCSGAILFTQKQRQPTSFHRSSHN